MQTAILISLVAILFAYLASNKSFKYGLEIAIALITIFVALRYEWGTDMPSYFRNFQEYSLSGLRFFDFEEASQIREGRSREIGWAVINILCRPIGFFGMIIVLAVVENVIIYDFIKRNVDKKYYWLAIFIYTMNPYLMVLGCSMIRQWLAMCTILFATRYIVSGQFWKYLLFVIIAASIHQSALLFLILYCFRFFKDVRLSTKNITLLIVIAFFWLFFARIFAQQGALFLMGTSMFDSYGGELDFASQNDKIGGFGFGVLFKLLLFIFCVAQAGRIDEEKRIICLMLLMYIFLEPFTSAVHLASRLNFYVDAITIAAIPIALKANPNKTFVTIVLLLFVFWNLFMYRIFFNADSFSISYHTYHTIFEAPSWQ